VNLLALIAHAPGTGKESQHVFPDAPDWPLRSDLGKITPAGFVVASLLKVQYVTSRWPMEDWDERWDFSNSPSNLDNRRESYS
jgi:hypothetical protein